MPTKRLPAKAKAMHLRQVQIWSDAGWPVHRMANAADQLWGYTRRELEAVLASVREEQTQAMSVERQQFLAQQMTRLEALAARAQEEGNLAVALSCYRELHQLAGLTKS